MRNIIIYAGNTYQIINAINLRVSVYRNDRVILVLQDCMNDTLSIVNNMTDNNIFDELFYFEERNYSRMTRVFNILRMVFGTMNKKYKRVAMLKCDFYIATNIQHDDYNILYEMLCKKNPNMECLWIEEGPLVFEDTFDICKSAGKTLPVAQRIRRLLGKPVAYEQIKRIMVSNSDKYHGSFERVIIPSLVDNVDILKNVLKSVFLIPDTGLKYSEKYIFFASVGGFEANGSIGEVEIVEQIANKVGKENLIVKKHPRDRTMNYYRTGLKIDERDSIPWEVMQLCGDFSKNVFLTVNSASVLSVNLEMPNPIKTFFLYKCCHYENNEFLLGEFKRIEEKLSAFSGEKTRNICFCESIDEIE